VIRSIRSLRHERGSSLMVSLLFMIVISMLGITIANTSKMEERMAGNTRDRNVALQAAEAALNDASVQLAIPGFRASAFPNYNPVLYGNSAAFWETCFVSGTPAALCAAVNKHTPATALPSSGSGAVISQPQYIVERKANTGPGGIFENFRVTVRAVGGTADSIVVLQSDFVFVP
jgi:type IV pilus assembly protein PilX